MSDHRESGAPAAVAVLLWIVVGWPLSWLLLLVSFPLAILFGVAITVAMLVVVVRAGRPRVAAPVFPVPMVAVPVFPVATEPDPRRSIRREVEGLAHIDAVGGCGWCGSPVAHVNDGGHPVHPRHWHAEEIEERIRERSSH